MHARTLTHCQSHTDTHPHVLTKNCKTDCEKCRMRWVGTIGDVKSILDFVYSMFVCVCVCVFCVFRLHTNHTCRRAQLSRSKHRNRLSLLARSIVSVGTAVLVLERQSGAAASSARERERDPNCPSASAAATDRVFGGSTLQLFSQYFLRYLVFCKHIQLA